MKKLYFILTVAYCLSFSGGAIGQVNSIFDEVEYAESKEGKVRIVQDEIIKTLVEKHQWTMSKTKGVMGYRIRIFSDSGPYAKKEFEYTKARFSENFGEIKIHPDFDYPFYKIYVGDFRSRSEALKVLKQIERFFGEDAFIVLTKINYPNLTKE